MDSQTGAPVDNYIASLVGPFWSAAQVCAESGVTVDTLTAWRVAGAVLGPETSDGVAVYPVSQFVRHGGRVEVRPGLRPFFRALRAYDPWAVAVLLVAPTHELHGRTPLAWLSSGGSSEAVAALGDAVAREWAAG